MSEVETVDRPPEGTRPRRRRWRYWVGVPLALVVLWLAVFYGYFVYWTDRDLREAMAEADRDSPGGWQLEAIDARREQVPDDENAALIVLRVKSLLPADWPARPVSPESADKDDGDSPAGPGLAWVERLDDLSPEVQVPASLLRRVRASLAQAEFARVEARKLIGMTRGRFPVEWDADILGTKLASPETRSAALLLRFEAILASQDGDADGAVALVRGLLGVAHSVGDEPLLISVLVRLARDQQAVATLERALAQGEPSARELEAVQALLEKEAAEPLFVQAMRGERAALHKMVLNLRHGAANMTQLTGGTGQVEKGVGNLLGPTLARRSHARMLQLLNEYVQAAQLPPEKQPPAMKDLNGKVIQAKLDWDIITSLVMPAVGKVSEAYRRGVGNLNCAAVAVALERYRRDHGRWPDSLGDLVPRYLAAVPKDPQDGKPLRYRRRPDGVVVYWVGLDGTDDGGNLERRNYLLKGTDQGFQLWEVSRRRQPVQEVLPPPTVRAVP